MPLWVKSTQIGVEKRCRVRLVQIANVNGKVFKFSQGGEVVSEYEFRDAKIDGYYLHLTNIEKPINFGHYYFSESDGTPKCLEENHRFLGPSDLVLVSNTSRKHIDGVQFIMHQRIPRYHHLFEDYDLRYDPNATKIEMRFFKATEKKNTIQFRLPNERDPSEPDLKEAIEVIEILKKMQHTRNLHHSFAKTDEVQNWIPDNAEGDLSVNSDIKAIHKLLNELINPNSDVSNS